MALDSFTPCFQATFLALLDVDCLDGSAALLLNNYGVRCASRVVEIRGLDKGGCG